MFYADGNIVEAVFDLRYVMTENGSRVTSSIRLAFWWLVYYANFLTTSYLDEENKIYIFSGLLFTTVQVLESYDYQSGYSVMQRIVFTLFGFLQNIFYKNQQKTQINVI